MMELEDLLSNSKLRSINEVYAVPTKPGIYGLYDNKGLLYIGKTSNLNTRLRDHKNGNTNSKWFHEGIKLFNFVEMNDKVDREIYETYYIALLSPLKNKDKVSFRKESIHKESYNMIANRIKQANTMFEIRLKFQYIMIVSIFTLLIFSILKVNVLAVWGIAVVLVLLVKWS